jgi:predicted transcriptional regulator
MMLRYHDVHDEWPTHREIADSVGIKSTNASQYLAALIRKGVAMKLDKGRRNVALTDKGAEMIRQGWQPTLF